LRMRVADFVGHRFRHYASLLVLLFVDSLHSLR
jgi:hypothetical protein